MAWDSTRPVPWEQLVRSWLIYVAFMAAVFLIFFRDRPLAGIFAGLLVSGPLYLAFGWALAKFGYRRKTWRQLREERTLRDEPTDDDGRAAPTSVTRQKPPPTKRTGGGASGRPGGSRKRRR